MWLGGRGEGKDSALPDDKSPDKVEAGFFAASAGDFVLGHSVVARDFGDGAEE